MKETLTIAIDFDGTIATEAYPEMGTLIKDADTVIQQLYADGHNIIINTCRTGKYEGHAVDFLNANYIPFHYINGNMPEIVKKYGGDSRKVSADIYIDNKDIKGIPTWDEIYTIIKTNLNIGYYEE